MIRKSPLLLATCLAAMAIVPPVQAKAAKETGDFSGAMIATGACALGGGTGTIDRTSENKSVLPDLISIGVNLFGKALSNAAAAKTWSATATNNVILNDTTFPSCIYVVRGRFYYDFSVDDGAEWGDLSAARSVLRAAHVNLAGPPDFYFEGQFVASGTEGDLTIRPLAVKLVKPIGSRLLRSDDERSVAVFASITKVGDKASLETAPAATLNLGKLKAGQLRRYTYPEKLATSPWDAAWFKLDIAKSNRALTLNALETETQDESKFLTFISGLLTDDAKSKVSTQLQAILVPGVAAANQATKDAATVQLRDTANGAFAAAAAATAVCSTASGKTTAEIKTAADAAITALHAFVVADENLPKGDDAHRGTLTLSMIDGPNGIYSGGTAAAPQRCNALLPNFTNP